eukprot:5768575-Heterocapsa_arctica.AAC.1
MRTCSHCSSGYLTLTMLSWATQVSPGTYPKRSDKSGCMGSRSHAPVRLSDESSTVMRLSARNIA